MKLTDLNTTQQLLIEKLDNEQLYVITRDLQVQDSTDFGFGVGTIGTTKQFVSWFITEHLESLFQNEKNDLHKLIDNLLTHKEPIKVLSDLFSITFVKGWKLGNEN